MAITDFTLEEVRVRQDALMQQMPNRIEAGQELRDGQFVRLSSTTNTWVTTGQDDGPTHMVLKSGIARLTASEITNDIGIVKQGEPTVAITGIGRVQIPFAGDVRAGQEITTLNGWAVAWDGDTGLAGGYVVGVALEAVTGATEADRIFADAFITLPARYSANPSS